MSTELISLKSYSDIDILYVTRYYGGTERNVCYQFTINEEFVQLERADIIDLITALQKSLEE